MKTFTYIQIHLPQVSGRHIHTYVFAISMIVTIELHSYQNIQNHEHSSYSCLGNLISELKWNRCASHRICLFWRETEDESVQYGKTVSLKMGTVRFMQMRCHTQIVSLYLSARVGAIMLFCM